MMCSRFLKHYTDKKHGRLFNAFENFFHGMLEVYKIGLRWSLRHRLIVMVFSAGVLLATFYLFKIIPRIYSQRRCRTYNGDYSGGSGNFSGGHDGSPAAGCGYRATDPDVNAFMSSVGGGRGPRDQFRFHDNDFERSQ